MLSAFVYKYKLSSSDLTIWITWNNFDLYELKQPTAKTEDFFFFFFFSETNCSGTSIIEADDRQVTTVFTVQPSFHHRHWTNPSIMKRYHRRWTCNHTSPRRSPMMVTLHDTGFVECRWWNDGWTVKTVVTWLSSASMMLAPGLKSSLSFLQNSPSTKTLQLWQKLPPLPPQSPLPPPPPPRWPASTSGAEDPRFESHLRRDFSGSSHTSDLKIGTPVDTQPGAWHYRVSAGTGRPGVSILWLSEVESLICNFHLSVAARKIACADPYLRYTSLLLGR